MTGKVNGKQVRIFEEIEGQGRNRETLTCIEFESSPFDFEFSIGKETFATKFGKFFGYNDIEFQDENFDKKFLLKSENEIAFRSLMDPQMQDELIAIELYLQGALVNSKKTFKYLLPGQIYLEEDLFGIEEILKFMVKMQDLKSDMK